MTEYQQMEISELSQKARDIVANLGQALFGIDEVIKLILVALASEGHVLLEGNPGLGKTSLVKKLSQQLRYDTKRIQFTPDLLPSDITTITRLDAEDSRLVIENGPIFTALLLADEINRATPKTQAALLEAMAEKQVTRNGVSNEILKTIVDQKLFIRGDEYETFRGTLPLFMVLATQNPIENEGTFELPEAQLDRFMFKILLSAPSADTLLNIIRKDSSEPAAELAAVFTSPEESINWFDNLKAAVRTITLSPTNQGRRNSQVNVIEHHIVKLILATNGQFESLRNPNDVKPLVEKLQFGLGPRAGSALMLAAKAYWLMFESRKDKQAGLMAVDAETLAHVLLPTLRHRLKIDWSAQEDFKRKYELTDRNRAIDYFLRDLAIQCAPTDGGYRGKFADELNKILVDRAV